MEERDRNLLNRETLYLIFRNKKLIVLVFAATFFFALLLHYGAQPKYEATAKILVKMGRERTADSLMTQSEAYYNAGLKSEDINTEIEIIKSPDLLKQLVTARGSRYFLGKEATGRPGSDIPRAVDSIQRRLAVEQIINTNVIEVRFTAPDAAGSAGVVNQLIDLYMDKHISVHSIKGVRELLARQAEAAKAELERIERKLESYYAGTDKKEQGYTTPRSSRVFRSEASESLSLMEKRMLELEFEKKKLLNRYRQDSQPVQEIEKQIGEINQMLIQERKKYGAQEKEYIELERQRSLAAERNLFYQKKLDEARILEAMDRNKIVSVTLLSGANPPLHPKGNPLALNIIFAFLTAGLLSSLVLVYRYTSDDTFHEETRVERILKLPVAACIPWMGRMEGDEREQPAKKSALPSAT